jgi:predicted nucleotidyltransferase
MPGQMRRRSGAGEEIWAFASRVRGDANDQSDLDLLVVLTNGHGLARPNLAAFRAVSKLRRRPPLDILAITQSQRESGQAHPFGLYGEIAQTGQKIHARQSA